MPKKVKLGPELTRRSGRFDVGATPQVIVHELSEDAMIRVINSGTTDFTLTYGTATAEIKKKCSRDFKIPSGKQLVAPVGAKGVYEYVGPIAAGQDGRSGRFSATGTASLVVVNDSDRFIYRVFNVGTTKITANTLSIESKCSLDIVVDGSLTIAGTDVEGAYEIADPTTGRNGMFSVNFTALLTTVVIVAGHPGPVNRRYRVINSGETAFDVWKDSTKIVTLNKDQSIDLDIAKLQQIGVQGTGKISGVYDFIGEIK